jgi:hypothetical protein
MLASTHRTFQTPSIAFPAISFKGHHQPKTLQELKDLQEKSRQHLESVMESPFASREMKKYFSTLDQRNRHEGYMNRIKQKSTLGKIAAAVLGFVVMVLSPVVDLHEFILGFDVALLMPRTLRRWFDNRATRATGPLPTVGLYEHTDYIDEIAQGKKNPEIDPFIDLRGRLYALKLMKSKSKPQDKLQGHAPEESESEAQYSQLKAAYQNRKHDSATYQKLQATLLDQFEGQASDETRFKVYDRALYEEKRKGIQHTTDRSGVDWPFF